MGYEGRCRQHVAAGEADGLGEVEEGAIRMSREAWAVAVCIAVVSLAIVYAGLCILGYMIRPGL
jgi:hypothetical protein